MKYFLNYALACSSSYAVLLHHRNELEAAYLAQVSVEAKALAVLDNVTCGQMLSQAKELGLNQLSSESRANLYAQHGLSQLGTLAESMAKGCVNADASTLA